jgi:homoserine dehydrogenase
MASYKLALLGFGNVGRAFANLLLRKRAELKQRYDVAFTVTGISTHKHGNVVNPAGVDLTGALELVRTGHSVNLVTTSLVTDSIDFIRKCGADVLFETTPVNHQTGQPAIDYIRTALEQGMYVVSANKGPVVHAYRDLTKLALFRGRKYYFESAVMDGAPIFSLFRRALPAVRLNGFRGILNSTTNLILTRMESGESFDAAVKHAQSIGLAETDPTADVEGWDAAIKVAALVTVLMEVPLLPQQVDRTGILGITPEMARSAMASGKRWKLICSAERDGEGVRGRVAPEQVPLSSPLYGVEGSSSIVEFKTDTLSSLSIVEGNPGPDTTAYGLLADFINAVTGG